MGTLGWLVKKLSLEQFFLNRKDILEWIYFLLWDGKDLFFTVGWLAG